MAIRRSDSTPATQTTQAAKPAKAPARDTTRRAKPKTQPAASAANVTEDLRRGMIAKAAYFHAERRGFAPGDEAQDWLKAEAEVDALLRATRGKRPQ